MALRYLARLLLLVNLFVGAAIAKTPLNFSTYSFEKDGSNFELYGNAEVRNATVRLFSKGRVIFRRPIRFLGTNPGFSTDFAFSMYKGGLDFFVVPKNKNVTLFSFVAVKFDSGSVEIDVGGEILVKRSNLSTVGLGLSGGQRLRCWIDYDGVSKNLEVRVGKLKDLRPLNESVLCPIDLSSFLWREAMYVGISSSSGQSSISSWSFAVKHGAPYLKHSEPLDPQSLSVKSDQDFASLGKRRSFPWRILVALMVGVACGVLVVVTISFFRAKVVKRHPVAPVEYPMLVHSMKSGFEKIDLDGGKIVAD